MRMPEAGFFYVSIPSARIGLMALPAPPNEGPFVDDFLVF